MTVQRALRISVWVEIALLGILTATGLWLSWFFVPTPARIYTFDDHGLQSSVALAARIRTLHILSGSLFIWVALGVLGLTIAAAAQDKTAPRSRIWILGAAFAVAALATSFTGFLLPWDQLALKAIRIGDDFNGMWTATYSHNIRFVLLGSREISQHTLRNWFLTHAFVLPPWLLSGLVLLRRSRKD